LTDGAGESYGELLLGAACGADTQDARFIRASV
jgi:hypothetical protein